MNEKQKKFLKWHFFIYIPLIFFLNKIEFSKIINPQKELEKTNYEYLVDGTYDIFLIYQVVKLWEI